MEGLWPLHGTDVAEETSCYLVDKEKVSTGCLQWEQKTSATIATQSVEWERHSTIECCSKEVQTDWVGDGGLLHQHGSGWFTSFSLMNV